MARVNPANTSHMISSSRRSAPAVDRGGKNTEAHIEPVMLKYWPNAFMTAGSAIIATALFTEYV